MRSLLFLSSVLSLAACVSEMGPSAGGPPAVDGGAPGGGDGGAPPVEIIPGVTYYKDVLPVLKARCTGCHTAGGVNFPLDTFESAKPWAARLAEVTASGQMPPWPPADGCNEFRDTRRLAPAELSVLASWVSGGAPAGDPKDAPAPTAPPAKRPPDLILDPGGSLTPTFSAGADLYWCVRLDPKITSSRDFVELQVDPDNDAMVHHVLFFREPGGSSGVGLPGFECAGIPGTASELLGGWVPGDQGTRFPEGVGMRLDPSDRILMQIHYHRPPAGTRTTDHTVGKMWFASGSVRRAQIVWVGTTQISLLPGVSGQSTSGLCQVPTNVGPVEVIAAAPHMHTLGKRIRSRLLRAGAEQCLIDIPDWDFEWQGTYFFDKSVTVYPGDSIVTSCTYDNTTYAPVAFGEGTTDEMCFNFLTVIPSTPLPTTACFQ